MVNHPTLWRLPATRSPSSLYDVAGIARDVNYLERLHQALEKKPGEPIQNSSVHEYQLFLEFIFTHATQYAKFVSKTFNPTVYSKPSVIAAARRFLLGPKSEIEIIVEDPSAIRDRHPFIIALQSFGKLELRFIHESNSDFLDINFALFDDFIYRLEPDKELPLGVVAFGDLDGFSKLSDLYDTLYRLSSPIPTATDHREYPPPLRESSELKPVRS